MVRAPAIRGRPALQRKHKSGATSTASAADSHGTLSLLPKANPASKALKRAQKRAQLLRKTGVITADDDDGGNVSNDPHASARKLLRLGAHQVGDGQGYQHQLSKSSLRRRKRKARDELAKDLSQGREGGIAELREAVEELEDAMDDEYDEQRDYDGQVSAAGGGGRVTANKRKQVLVEEQRRQQAILTNPTFKASPFAAIREHARNSMARI